MAFCSATVPIKSLILAKESLPNSSSFHRWNISRDWLLRRFIATPYETTDIKVLLSVHVSRSSQEEHDVQIDDQPATPLVRKRKRRVAQKITTSAQGIQLPARKPDIVSEPTSDINFESMEIKYLKQALASVVQPSTKAEVYLRYLAKCDFNTTLEPHSIIKFNQDDVRSMVGIGQNPNRAEEVRQFLNKKQHKCSAKYL
ncbi:hypothetical protein P5673_011590 [Acropora cervicornis]|uniref:Uncharacterized protein n=1 Tax=Acropora cervicornis TaxID=6130 RepID=A0AAD9V878_ACRCE|nr:hypothetical protein P5673_011590 [Acropora cervicornis]